MSASYDLFCRWKHVQKIQSDNAGALALGVSRATVSLWKQGKNAEIHFVERMAVDIGDSPEMWSAVVMAERSSSEDEKAAWRRIAQKLATVAMALLLAVGFALPRDAEAMQARNGAQDIHYAKYGIWSSEVRGFCMPMAAPLARVLTAAPFPQQGRTGSVMEFDPYSRTELTGTWAGFAFLGNRLITSEGRELLLEDLAWLSLTTCQAQEWRQMMGEFRSVDP